jgi:hypothetical protein
MLCTAAAKSQTPEHDIESLAIQAFGMHDNMDAYGPHHVMLRRCGVRHPNLLGAQKLREDGDQKAHRFLLCYCC